MLRKIIGLSVGLCAIAALIEKQWFVATFLFLLAWVLLRRPGPHERTSDDDPGWGRSDHDERYDSRHHDDRHHDAPHRHAPHHHRDDVDDAHRHREECSSDRDGDRDEDVCDATDDGGSDSDDGGGSGSDG